METIKRRNSSISSKNKSTKTTNYTTNKNFSSCKKIKSSLYNLDDDVINNSNYPLFNNPSIDQTDNQLNSNSKNINIRMKINNINFKNTNDYFKKHINQFKKDKDLERYSNSNKKSSDQIGENGDDNIGGVITKIKNELTEISKCIKNSEEKMDKIKSTNTHTNLFSSRVNEKKNDLDEPVKIHRSSSKKIENNSNVIIDDLRNKNKTLEKELQNIRGKFLDMKFNQNNEEKYRVMLEDFNNKYEIEGDTFIKSKDKELQDDIRRKTNDTKTYLDDKNNSRIKMQSENEREDDIEFFYKEKFIKQEQVIRELQDIIKSKNKSIFVIKKGLNRYLPEDLSAENYEITSSYLSVYDNSKWFFVLNKNGINSFWIIEQDLLNAGFELNNGYLELDSLELKYESVKQEFLKIKSEIFEMKQYFLNQINSKDEQLNEAKKELELINCKSSGLVESVNKFNNLNKQIKSENKELKIQLEEKLQLLINWEEKSKEANEKLQFYIKEYNKMKLANENLIENKFKNSNNLNNLSEGKYTNLLSRPKEIENIKLNYEEKFNLINAQFLEKENALKEQILNYEKLKIQNEESKESINKSSEEINNYKKEIEILKNNINNLNELLNQEKSSNKNLKVEIVQLHKQIENIPNVISEEIMKYKLTMSRNLQDSVGIKIKNINSKLEHNIIEKTSIPEKLNCVTEEENILKDKNMKLLKELADYEKKFKDFERIILEKSDREKKYLIHIELLENTLKENGKEEAQVSKQFKRISIALAKETKSNSPRQEILLTDDCSNNLSDNINQANKKNNFVIARNCEINFVKRCQIKITEIKEIKQEDKDEISTLTNKIYNLTELVEKRDEKEKLNLNKIKQLKGELELLKKNYKILKDQQDLLQKENQKLKLTLKTTEENLTESKNSREECKILNEEIIKELQETVQNTKKENEKLIVAEKELRDKIFLLEKDKDINSSDSKKNEDQMRLCLENFEHSNTIKENLIKELKYEVEVLKNAGKEEKLKILNYEKLIADSQIQSIEFINYKKETETKTILLNEEIKLSKRNEDIIMEKLNKITEKFNSLISKQESAEKDLTVLASINQEQSINIKTLEKKLNLSECKEKDLLNRINELVEELNDLKEKLNLCEIKERDLLNKIRELEINVNRFTIDNETITSQLKNQISLFKEKETSLIDKIDQLVFENQKMLQNEKSLKNEIEKLLELIETLKSDKVIEKLKYNELNIELTNSSNKLYKNLEYLSEQNKNLKENEIFISSNLKLKEEEVSQIKRELLEKNGELLKFKDKLEKIDLKFYQNLEIKYNNLKTELKEKEINLVNSLNKISELKKCTEDLIEQLKNKEGQENVLEPQRNIEGLENVIEQQKNKIINLEGIIGSKDREILENHIINQDTEIKIEKLNEENSNLVEENEKLKSEINSLKMKLKEFNQELLNLKENNKLKKSNELSNIDISILNDELQMKLVEIEIIKEELHKKDVDLIKFKEDFIKLQFGYQDAIDSLNEKEKDIENYKKINDKLIDKLNDLKGNDKNDKYNEDELNANNTNILITLGKSEEFVTANNKTLTNQEEKEEVQNYKNQVYHLKELIFDRDEELLKLSKENQNYKIEIEKMLRTNEPDNLSVRSRISGDISGLILPEDESKLKEKLNKYKQTINSYRADNKTLLNQMGILKAEIKNMYERNKFNEWNNFEECRTQIEMLLDNYKPKNKDSEEIVNKIKNYFKLNAENVRINTTELSEKQEKKGFFGGLFSVKKKK